MTNIDQTIQEIERKYPSRKVEETIPTKDKNSGIVAGLNYFAYLTFALSALMILIGSQILISSVLPLVLVASRQD